MVEMMAVCVIDWIVAEEPPTVPVVPAKEPFPMRKKVPPPVAGPAAPGVAAMKGEGLNGTDTVRVLGFATVTWVDQAAPAGMGKMLSVDVMDVGVTMMIPTVSWRGWCRCCRRNGPRIVRLLRPGGAW
jgi:hypothetical protein